MNTLIKENSQAGPETHQGEPNTFRHPRPGHPYHHKIKDQLDAPGVATLRCLSYGVRAPQEPLIPVFRQRPFYPTTSLCNVRNLMSEDSRGWKGTRLSNSPAFSVCD
ncbi:hypothetical protein E2C01_005196 [Portunus trituberculatus]|uniref:Uncharacterized protein n=1 Tax=Portunus trituberculatus TaxID=210409 RepID=A0A5B7CRW1_PORTR|nr:hypothetical protein [Portunus trituberculatus]